VKFVCGLQPPVQPPQTQFEPPVKPGNYATAVNVHNYHPSQTVPLAKKAVIALQEDTKPRGPISRLVSDSLDPDQAFEVDCNEIVGLLQTAAVPLPPFIKGFVEIVPTDGASLVAALR